MTDLNRHSPSREERLDAAVAEYLAAVDRGQQITTEEFLTRHADLAPELRNFFENRDMIGQLAALGAGPVLAPGQTTADGMSDSPSQNATWPATGDDAESIEGPPGYEILGLLGRGGMGVVYRARQPGLDRLVALKMVLAGAHTDPERRMRFYNEAKAVARLQHPHIVQIFEVGEHLGVPYFSMEYVEDGTLANRMTGSPWPVPKAVAVVEALARGVQAAHEARIIHRDLKPGNVLISAQGTPKIADFGLAKWLDQEAQTESGLVLGTPAYMAPEQAGGYSKNVGPPADVFALGVILYELLTGQPLFKGPTPLDSYFLVLNSEAPPPSKLNARVPRDLDTICLKCLQKEPSRRYVDGAELADDLARFARGESVRARPIGRPARIWRWCRQNPMVATLLGAVLTLLAGGVAGVTWKWHEADTRRQEAEANLKRADAIAEAELAAHRRADSLVADLSRESFHQGLANLEQGNGVRGMLELARALELAPASAEDLNQVIRANMDGWSRKLPPPLQSLLRGRPPKSLKIYPPPGGDIPLYAAAFSPDGRSLVTGGDDCVVQLWDIVSGQPAGDPFEHKAAIRSLVFSPDGQKIFAGGFVGEARLWDRTSGTPSIQLVGHQADVGCAAFSPDGRTILTGSTDKTVRQWDARSGQILGSPLMHPGAVWGVAVSANGTLAVTACKDRLARLWDLARGQLVGTPMAHPDDVTAVAFAPDGKTILTGCKDGIARCWDVATTKTRGPALKQSGRLNAVAFSPDGKLVLTCGQDRTACLWDATTGSSLCTPVANPTAIKAGTFSPDGRTFLTAGMDGAVRIWQTPQLREREVLPHENYVTAVAFSPDGKMLLTGSACLPFPIGNGSVPFGSGQLQLWDVATRQAVTSPFGQPHMVLSVAFNPAGSRFLTGGGVFLGSSGEFQLWDTATREPIRHQSKLVATVNAVCFSPSGQFFAVGSGKGEPGLAKKALTLIAAAGMSKAKLESRLDRVEGQGELVIYETETGRPVRSFPHPSWVNAAAFTPDGKMLITGGPDGVVRRWNVADGNAVGKPISVRDSVLGIAVSPDGSMFLTGAGNGVANLWNTETGEFTGKAFAQKSWIRAVAFSPRDSTVLCAGGNRSARLWDTRTGEPVGPALEHLDSVLSVAFSPDGQRLVTGGCDNCVRFWEAPSPSDASVERMKLRIQLCTGAELSREGDLRWLDPSTWQERQRLLSKLEEPR
jgi:WD40 repeat protein